MPAQLGAHAACPRAARLRRRAGGPARSRRGDRERAALGARGGARGDGRRHRRHDREAMTLSDSELERYSRQLVLPEWSGAAQERLKGASAIVIGAGAPGSPGGPYPAAGGGGGIGGGGRGAGEVSHLPPPPPPLPPDIGVGEGQEAAG